MEKGFIYIIKSGKKFKLGSTTKSVQERFRSIDATSPVRLTLLWYQEVNDRKGIEWRLHQLYKDKRIKGEWFILTPVEIEYIKLLVSAPERLLAEVTRVVHSEKKRETKFLSLGGKLHRCVSMRDFLRNSYRVLPDPGEKIILTRHGDPAYTVSAVTNMSLEFETPEGNFKVPWGDQKESKGVMIHDHKKKE